MDNEYILGPDGELYHWGIKGMKWGQRRYQNKDGSLTPLGKKRYAQEEEALKARERVIKNKERIKARSDKLAAKKAELDAREKALKDAEEAANPKKVKTKDAKVSSKKKTIADMTDEELQRAIDRGNLENRYRQVYPEPAPKKNKLVAALEPVLINAGKDAIDSVIKNATKAMFGEKGDGLPPVKTWDDLTKREQYRKAKRENDEAASSKSSDKGDNGKSSDKGNGDSGNGNKGDNGKTSSQKPSNKQTEREASDERAQAIVDKIVNANNNRKEAARAKEAADIYGTKEYEQKVDRMLKEMDDAGWKLWEEMYGSGN